MLSIIGFGILWIIVWVVAGMAINMMRVSNGHIVTESDSITSFIQGIAFGPIAMMAAFSPAQSAKGKTMPLLVGGSIGSYIAYAVFVRL